MYLSGEFSGDLKHTGNYSPFDATESLLLVSGPILRGFLACRDLRGCYPVDFPGFCSIVKDKYPEVVKLLKAAGAKEY